MDEILDLLMRWRAGKLSCVGEEPGGVANIRMEGLQHNMRQEYFSLSTENLIKARRCSYQRAQVLEATEITHYAGLKLWRE